MERPTRAILVSVLVLGLLVSGIGCAAIDAGHEGVLVEQPFFFGHGGVDPVPSKTGRVWLAPTTHVISRRYAGQFNTPSTSILFG